MFAGPTPMCMHIRRHLDMPLVLSNFRAFVSKPCSVSLPGASTVKWTNLESYIGLSEIDSQLYTNFEFCEGKITNNLKNTFIYMGKQSMLTNCFSRKVYIF
jgi:hypothetical protein